jgi:hypothetical protein
MADPIIAIATIRAAARQAVLANVPVQACPPAFRFVEELWRSEYWFAHYELHGGATRSRAQPRKKP